MPNSKPVTARRFFRCEAISDKTSLRRTHVWSTCPLRGRPHHSPVSARPTTVAGHVLTSCYLAVYAHLNKCCCCRGRGGLGEIPFNHTVIFTVNSFHSQSWYNQWANSATFISTSKANCCSARFCKVTEITV